ncbi:MAG: threonine ammonia-lyase [Beijerinckiaceae bacterium]
MSAALPFAITFDDIIAARARIKGHAVVTPLLTSPDLDQLTGARVFVKAEPLQKTGSFKFRGAYNRISQLTAEQRKLGVVAYSSGNHAQGVAYAARTFGVKATIIMPKDSPKLKIDNTRGYGADVILYDRFGENREAIGQRVSAETGAILVPPYDDPNIMAGQGTIGIEVVEQLAEMGLSPDVLLCCCGGGGLMSGIATALNKLSPATAVYAVEPVNFDDTKRSLEAGHHLSNAAGPMSICDAIVTPTPGKLTFPINKAYLKGGLAVSDAEAAQAVAYAARVLKITAEPGGAVALAAAMTGKVDIKGKTVVVVVSGGNIDPSLHAAIVAANGLPN